MSLHSHGFQVKLIVLPSWIDALEDSHPNTNQIPLTAKAAVPLEHELYPAGGQLKGPLELRKLPFPYPGQDFIAPVGLLRSVAAILLVQIQRE